MSQYEEEIKKEIKNYLNKEEGYISKITNKITAPVQWATDKMVPVSAITAMTKAFEGGLGLVNDVSQYTYSEKALFNSFAERGYEVSSVKDISELPFEVCDIVAQEFISSNKLIGAFEGAALGIGGLISMAADIPAIMTINFRMLSQIANSYGFDTSTELEKIYLLQIFSLSGAGNQSGKAVAWNQLQKIAVDVAKKKTWKQLEKYSVVIVIKEIAEKLGIRLTKRKLGQLVPVIGAGVGGGLNYLFTRDNGVAALMAYRQRRFDGGDKTLIAGTLN